MSFDCNIFHSAISLNGDTCQALEQRLWAGAPKRLAPKRSKAKAQASHVIIHNICIYVLIHLYLHL